MMDDDLIPISALQHFLFCPRQCALIHVEQLWAEDLATVEGRLLHEAVDSGFGEQRGSLRVARGISLVSNTLGLVGRADAVEFRNRPVSVQPVEYKRGKPKTHRADEVQLCAQALCLEEMLQTSIPSGALYYGTNRRRHQVSFDQALRDLTINTARDARAMLRAGTTPPARFQSGCKRCSLNSLCQPKHFEVPVNVDRWFSSRIQQALEEGS